MLSFWYYTNLLKLYPILCSASIFVWMAPSCPTSLSSSASTSFCIRGKNNTSDEQNEYEFYFDLSILNLVQIHAVQYIFTFSIKTYLINWQKPNKFGKYLGM